MKFEVEKEMVEPIIRDQIAAAVVEQLGDPTELIRKMVHLALTHKVNSDGNVGQYSSDNKFDFIEAVAGKTIRAAATEAIQRVVTEKQKEIEDAVVAELTRRPRKTAAAIVAAFVQSTQSMYRLTANFEFRGKEDY